MELRRMLCFCVFFLFFLSEPAFSLTISMYPQVLDLGTVEKGTEVPFRFFISSDYDRDIEVSVDFFKPHDYVYIPGQPKSFSYNESQASRENIGSWFSFGKKVYFVPPEKKTYSYAGKLFSANEEGSGTIKIPLDAESGYHIASLSVSPSLNLQNQGMGVAVLSVSRPLILFRVEGNAYQSGDITGFDVKRTGYASADAIAYFRNTGTTTIYVRANALKVYEDGKNLSSHRSSYTAAAPGEIVSFASSFNSKNLDSGVFTVDARVEWFTGSVFSEGGMDIPYYVPVHEEKKITEKQAGAFQVPWGVIILLSLIIIYYLFNRRD